METLDGFFEKEAIELEPEILLKLDIQGYEDRVLRGASALLKKTRACLLEGNFDPLYDGQAHLIFGLATLSAHCLSLLYAPPKGSNE